MSEMKNRVIVALIIVLGNATLVACAGHRKSFDNYANCLHDGASKKTCVALAKALGQTPPPTDRDMTPMPPAPPDTPAPSPPAHAATPAPLNTWVRLHVGMTLYTGTDGGDATTLTVCPTVAQYLAFAGVGGSGNVAECSHRKPDVAAIVEEIVPANADDPFHAPYVKLRAADGSWSGYTDIIGQQVAIPVGTTLVFTKSGGESLRLAPRQGSNLHSGPNLGDSVTVKVLHYFPNTNDRSLYVTVLDGEYAGQNGWMFTMDGETENGISIEGVSYTPATPEPTTKL